MNSLASFLTLILMLVSLWALIVNPSLASSPTDATPGKAPN